ncbi:MAG: threonine synthase [Clostridia bacterium]|nr:threonine synthase [Clostridia bacterium]
MLQYRSTRSSVAVSPSEAILTGLAPDGGLLVPETLSFPEPDWKDLIRRTLPDSVSALLAAFFPDLADRAPALAHVSYAGKFDHPELVPTVSLGDGLFVSELFHGPTAAFKDVALSVLPHLMTAARDVCGVTDEIAVLTATSGDTGKAALEGFRDVPGTRIVVFYPLGGVSAVQRAQMVTQEGSNVAVAAVRGNFDDAQAGVKEIFRRFGAEDMLREKGVRLSSANSINAGRLVPQISYYFKAYGDLVRQGAIKAGDAVDFAVPTGNFGNILAGYLARRLGLPVGRLICASNANDVLCDFLRTGLYDRRRPFYKTDSPSMDILVSSNLERALFFLSEDDALCAALMRDLAENGAYTVPGALRDKMGEIFSGYRASDEDAAGALLRAYRTSGYAADPHTAVALRAVELHRASGMEIRPTVVLATASPYKFSRPVLRALGRRAEGDEFDLIGRLHGITGAPVPPGLAALKGKPELHPDAVEPKEMASFVLRKACGVA